MKESRAIHTLTRSTLSCLFLAVAVSASSQNGKNLAERLGYEKDAKLLIGFMYPTVKKVGRHADPSEIEKEIRAQIERAMDFGIRPTHLDTHMGSVAASPEIFQIYLKLGREYNLPLLIPRSALAGFPDDTRRFIEREHIILDGLFMLFRKNPGSAAVKHIRKCSGRCSTASGWWAGARSKKRCSRCKMC